MKAMILAAGRGERMRPLTDTTPKPLLMVGGKRLIEYHLEALRQAGISDVVINHAWLGDQIEAVLGDGHHYGINITYSPEQVGLETAGGVQHALPLLGDEPFIVVNGDIWTDYSYHHLSGTLTSPYQAHLVLVNNPEYHPQGDFALQAPRVLEDGEHKLTFSGVGVYHPDMFKALEPGIRPLAPVLRELMQQQRVSGEHYQGRWFDIGTPERLAQFDVQLMDVMSE